MKKLLFFWLCSIGISLASFGALNITVVVANSSCPAASNGMIIINATGGTAPYQYSINGAVSYSFSNTFSGLAAGSYSVMVIDAMGDSGSQMVPIFSGVGTIQPVWVSVCVNDLPYNFNGANIFVAGNYTDTLTSSIGCDSIIMLSLTINPVLNSSINVSVCPTQLPYDWNGQQYSSSGVYNTSFTGSSGCDSIATLFLVVLTSTEWVGSISTSWEEPLNWSCGVPGPLSDVIINSGTVVLHSSTTINSLTLNPAATLTISPGVNLTILH